MALVSISDPIIYPYTSDSLAYIEAAQNLLAGNGLFGTPFDPAPYDAGLEPLRLFPPGYPIFIAGISLLGLNVAKAALGISIFAWIVTIKRGALTEFGETLLFADKSHAIEISKNTSQRLFIVVVMCGKRYCKACKFVPI